MARWAGIIGIIGVLGCTASHERATLSDEDFLAEAALLACRIEMACEPWGILPRGACHPEADLRRQFGLGSCPGIFNPYAAERCLEGMRTDSCADAVGRWLTETACMAVFASPSPEGSSCERYGCGDDEFCGPSPECTGEACPWSCQPMREMGEPCSWAARGDGFVSGLGDLGVRAPECAEGLECVVVARDVAQCGPPARVGDACVSTCSDWLDCVDGRCQTVDAVGQACNGLCFGGLVCRDGTCQARTVAGGACDDCTGSDSCWGTVCAEGLLCTDGVCTVVIPPGGACSTGAVCALGFHCAAGRCEADPVAGEPCGADAPCVRGVCTAGTCVLLEEGAACELPRTNAGPTLGPCASQCDGSECLPFIEDGERCHPYGTAGGMCRHGSACDVESERCVPMAELCR